MRRPIRIGLGWESRLVHPSFEWGTVWVNQMGRNGVSPTKQSNIQTLGGQPQSRQSLGAVISSRGTFLFFLRRDDLWCSLKDIRRLNGHCCISKDGYGCTPLADKAAMCRDLKGWMTYLELQRISNLFLKYISQTDSQRSKSTMQSYRALLDHMSGQNKTDKRQDGKIVNLIPPPPHATFSGAASTEPTVAVN